MAESIERSIRIDRNAHIDIKRASSRDPQREPRPDNLNIVNTHLLKLHASFKREDDASLYIRDQYLTFGTVLNGKVLSPRFWFPVVLGDVLQLIILKPSIFIRRRLEGSTAQALDLSEFGNSQTALSYSIGLESGDILALKPLDSLSSLGICYKSEAFDVSKVHPVLSYDGAELSAWGLAEGTQLDKFLPELDDSGSQITEDLEKPCGAVIVPELDNSSKDPIEVVLVVNESSESGLGAVYENLDDDDKDWNGEKDTYLEDTASECSEDGEENSKVIAGGNRNTPNWCSSRGIQVNTGGNISKVCGYQEAEEEEEEEEDDDDDDDDESSDVEEDVDDEEDSYDEVDEDEEDAFEIKDVDFDIHFDEYECDDDYNDEYAATLGRQGLCVCRKRTFSERDDEDIEHPVQLPHELPQIRPVKKARISAAGVGAFLKAVGKEALRGSFYAFATIVVLGIYGLSTD